MSADDKAPRRARRSDLAADLGGMIKGALYGAFYVGDQYVEESDIVSIERT